MRAMSIFLSFVLLHCGGCACRQSMTIIAEGRVASHAVYMPEISGIDAYGTGNAVIRAEYRMFLP